MCPFRTFGSRRALTNARRDCVLEDGEARTSCYARIVTMPSPGQPYAIARAKYKLRQAELAFAHLRQVPAEIAADLRQARKISHPDLRLDTFFFSCLGLAKSAYYIIKDDQGSRYRDAIHSWRMNVLNHKGRTQFNRMMKLRDNDVHQGRSDGRILATMMPIERSSDDWMNQRHANYAALGISPPVTEHKNPDSEIATLTVRLPPSMFLSHSSYIVRNSFMAAF